MVLLETYYKKYRADKALYPSARFISVSRELPHTKEGKLYNPCEERDIILAPSRKLVKAYKNGEITWPEYVLLFKDEMSTAEGQGAMWVTAQRVANKDICLVCFEGPKDGEKCHRFLLLDMICKVAINNGINLQVIKTGHNQPNKRIKSKKKVPEFLDF